MFSSTRRLLRQSRRKASVTVAVFILLAATVSGVDVAAAELSASPIANGDFSDGLAGWDQSNDNRVVAVNGSARIDGDESQYTYVAQSTPIEGGNTYTLRADVLPRLGTDSTAYLELRYYEGRVLVAKHSSGNASGYSRKTRTLEVSALAPGSASAAVVRLVVRPGSGSASFDNVEYVVDNESEVDAAANTEPLTDVRMVPVGPESTAVRWVDERTGTNKPTHYVVKVNGTSVSGLLTNSGRRITASDGAPMTRQFWLNQYNIGQSRGQVCVTIHDASRAEWAAGGDFGDPVGVVPCVDSLQRTDQNLEPVPPMFIDSADVNPAWVLDMMTRYHPGCSSNFSCLFQDATGVDVVPQEVRDWLSAWVASALPGAIADCLLELPEAESGTDILKGCIASAFKSAINEFVQIEDSNQIVQVVIDCTANVIVDLVAERSFVKNPDLRVTIITSILDCSSDFFLAMGKKKPKLLPSQVTDEALIAAFWAALLTPSGPMMRLIVGVGAGLGSWLTADSVPDLPPRQRQWAEHWLRFDSVDGGSLQGAWNRLGKAIAAEHNCLIEKGPQAVAEPDWSCAGGEGSRLTVADVERLATARRTSSSGPSLGQNDWLLEHYQIFGGADFSSVDFYRWVYSHYLTDDESTTVLPEVRSLQATDRGDVVTLSWAVTWPDGRQLDTQVVMSDDTPEDGRTEVSRTRVTVAEGTAVLQLHKRNDWPTTATGKTCFVVQHIAVTGDSRYVSGRASSEVCLGEPADDTSPPPGDGGTPPSDGGGAPTNPGAKPVILRFDVTPTEGDEACDRLNARQFVCKAASFDAGHTLNIDVVAHTNRAVSRFEFVRSDPETSGTTFTSQPSAGGLSNEPLNNRIATPASKSQITKYTLVVTDAAGIDSDPVTLSVRLDPALAPAEASIAVTSGSKKVVDTDDDGHKSLNLAARPGQTARIQVDGRGSSGFACYWFDFASLNSGSLGGYQPFSPPKNGTDVMGSPFTADVPAGSTYQYRIRTVHTCGDPRPSSAEVRVAVKADAKPVVSIGGQTSYVADRYMTTTPKALVSLTPAGSSDDEGIVSWRWFDATSGRPLSSGSGSPSGQRLMLPIGTHSLCLTLWDALGSAQTCTDVTVANPAIDLRMNVNSTLYRDGQTANVFVNRADADQPSRPLAGLTIYAAEQTLTGSSYRWDWTLEGGQTGRKLDRSRLDIALPIGTHTVKLTATSRWETKVAQVTIVVAKPAGVAPTVKVSGNQTVTANKTHSGSLAAYVVVRDAGSFDPDRWDQIVSRRWTGAALSSPVSAGVLKRHFPVGNHTIKYTVTDTTGKSSTATVVIKVLAPETVRPEKPTNVAIQAIHYGDQVRAKVTWTSASDNHTGWRIRGPLLSHVRTVSGDQTFYEYPASAGSRQCVQVQAVHESGGSVLGSDWTPEVCVTMPEPGYEGGPIDEPAPPTA